METNSLNKTPQELREMYQTLRDAVRNYVSRILEDHKATKDNPLEIYAALEFNSMGLSTLEMPNVISMFQDTDGSGMIWCNTDWHDEPCDFDDLYLDDQIDIVNEIRMKIDN